MSIVAQLKVAVFFFFFFFIPHPPECLCLQEIHEEDLHRSDADEEPRKTTQSNAGEDWVPSVVVDRWIGGGFDGLIDSG